MFKDHLVTWIEQYITDTYPKKEASKILADIDRRYAYSHLPLLIQLLTVHLGLRLYPPSLGYDVFLKVARTNSGQVMILKR